MSERFTVWQDGELSLSLPPSADPALFPEHFVRLLAALIKQLGSAGEYELEHHTDDFSGQIKTGIDVGRVFQDDHQVSLFYHDETQGSRPTFLVMPSDDVSVLNFHSYLKEAVKSLGSLQLPEVNLPETAEPESDPGPDGGESDEQADFADLVAQFRKEFTELATDDRLSEAETLAVAQMVAGDDRGGTFLECLRRTGEIRQSYLASGDPFDGYRLVDRYDELRQRLAAKRESKDALEGKLTALKAEIAELEAQLPPDERPGEAA